MKNDATTSYSDDGITCPHCGKDMSRAAFGAHLFEHKAIFSAHKTETAAQRASFRAVREGRQVLAVSPGTRRNRYGKFPVWQVIVLA